jgi:small subunit ribosomal protein S14
MAKKSVRNRNEKRIKLVNRLRPLRDKLREDVSNIHLSDKERWDAMQKLQALPRDSSPTRRRNRCKLCGRPRAYNRLTGLCRLHMRAATINGMVPGMHKASW